MSNDRILKIGKMCLELGSKFLVVEDCNKVESEVMKCLGSLLGPVCEAVSKLDATSDSIAQELAITLFSIRYHLCFQAPLSVNVLHDFHKSLEKTTDEIGLLMWEETEEELKQKRTIQSQWESVLNSFQSSWNDQASKYLKSSLKSNQIQFIDSLFDQLFRNRLLFVPHILPHR